MTKLRIAAKVLSRHLNPQGTNPLDALHDLASDGIHDRSEDECLAIFDRCKAAFEYVFRELDVQAEVAKAYLEALLSVPSARKDVRGCRPEKVDNRA